MIIINRRNIENNKVLNETIKKSEELKRKLNDKIELWHGFMPIAVEAVSIENYLT
jgi:hypothetical protein